MARKVFFSFHYERDVWRVGQVRNSNIITGVEKSGFIDSAEWQSIERQGRAAIERWIANQLNGTSVTVVLIGTETSTRPWVIHEIIESWNRGNGILGVYIHNMKNSFQRTDQQGANPLDNVLLGQTPLSRICKTYDWVYDDGRDNLGSWIEEAAAARE